MEDLNIPNDRDWFVKRCNSAQELALVVMSLEEKKTEWDIKVVDPSSLVVLAERINKGGRIDG